MRRRRIGRWWGSARRRSRSDESRACCSRSSHSSRSWAHGPPPSSAHSSQPDTVRISIRSYTGGFAAATSWRYSLSCNACCGNRDQSNDFSWRVTIRARRTSVRRSMRFPRAPCRPISGRHTGECRSGPASAISFPARPPERMQTPQPVSSMDGPKRRDRSRRVDSGVTCQAHHSAGHACDPPWTMPAPYALRQSRVEDGCGDHLIASRARPRRSRPLRLFSLPRGNDERVWIWPCPGQPAMSATQCVSTESTRP